MTRVVVASRLFVPEVSAGAFRLGSLAAGLARRGARVQVVTSTPPANATDQPIPTGVRVSRWPVLRDRGGNVRGYVQYASFDGPLLLRLLFRRFDVLVAESPPTTALVAAAVCWIRRRPLVYYAADVWTDGVTAMGAAKPVVSLMRSMERTVLRRARTVLSVSEEVTERLLRFGARADRVATIGNGIDTAIFTVDTEPAAPGSRYFVYTGTMSEWQRPDLFVKAFAIIAAEHPDVDLRFFGQGALAEELRQLADRVAPGRVHFGGVVSPFDSARWIRGAVASLVSVAPGIGYDFARPTKTYAAAACGTPVLFTGAPVGAAIVSEGGLGEAVGFTPDDIADGMRRLIAALDSGETERRRTERARWARENVSLAAVGEKAASEVLAAAN